jgi:hypothetical protein
MSIERPISDPSMPGSLYFPLSSGGHVQIYDTTLCVERGVVGPVLNLPVNTLGTSFGEAVQDLGGAEYLQYISTGLEEPDRPRIAQLGSGFAPNTRSRYLSIKHGDGVGAIALNVPHIEPGMEEHMIAVALWAQLLKDIRRASPEQLEGTFYEGDSHWRREVDPLFGVMATAFTTTLAGHYSKIGDEKEREIVHEVHAGEADSLLPLELIEEVRGIVQEQTRAGLAEQRPSFGIVYQTNNWLTVQGYFNRRTR